MSINAQWGNNEKTIIIVQFLNDWSWSEIIPVRESIVDMVESVPHIVDYIADFRETDRIPTGGLAVGRSIYNNRIRNEGACTVVGVSPILRMLYRTFITAYPIMKNELLFVPTMNLAYQTLAEIQDDRDNT